MSTTWPEEGSKNARSSKALVSFRLFVSLYPALVVYFCEGFRSSNLLVHFLSLLPICPFESPIAFSLFFLFFTFCILGGL